MNYVLMEYADKGNFCATGKARDDAANILKNLGGEQMPLFQAKQKKTKVLFQMAKSFIGVSCKLHAGDSVTIQYPYNPQFVNEVLISSLHQVCKSKKSKLIVLMHDLNSLRGGEFSSQEVQNHLKKECKLLNKADCIIAHNDKMIHLMNEFESQLSCVNLEIFDYLYQGAPAKVHFSPTDYTLIVAGNLNPAKCGYLYDLPLLQRGKFALYGIEYDEKRQKNGSVVYRGAYSPDELIAYLEGSFGLVWDGTSSETCAGSTGEYLKFNNPHKVSLYLAAGIPVIVWSKSAMADFVRQNKVGLAVDSIQDIDNKLQGISTDEYKQICSNASLIGEKLRMGLYTATAMDAAQKY